MRFTYGLTLFSALCATSVDAKSPFSSNDIGIVISGLVGRQEQHSKFHPLTQYRAPVSVTDALNSNNYLENFWEETQKLGPRAVQVVLDEATKKFPQTAQEIENFKDGMTQIVDQAQKIHTEIHNAIPGKGITIEHVTDLLSRELAQIYHGLENEVNDPLPEDRGERASARARLIRQVMEKVGVAYIHVLTEVGVPREQAETQFSEFSPKLTHALLIAGKPLNLLQDQTSVLTSEQILGNIIDKHPILLQAIVFAASMFLLPEIPILRSIVALFGFGPSGPVKGKSSH